MSLPVETFSNVTGGNVLYKALAHPLAAAPARELSAELSRCRSVAVYDPLGVAATVAVFVSLTDVALSGVYVQDARRAGDEILGLTARPVDRYEAAEALFVLAFDAEALVAQIGHLVDSATTIHTLDRLRIPEDWLSRPKPYLQPLNFVTNFAFFRDLAHTHTRLSTANYWSRYGASDPHLCGLLFDGDGRELARFRDPLGGPGAALILDSRSLRKRFDLPDYCGQLFLHVAGAAGHDVLKYALDVYGEAAAELSCTHDANAWPAERYAGLPLPLGDESTTLWVQNSHPLPIPAGALALRPFGGAAVSIPAEIGPFATRSVDLGKLLDEAAGSQVEFIAGKHVVRPRYEIRRRDHARIAHLNVVRGDLGPDPDYWAAAEHLGKGFLLTAPRLPPERFASEVLITPMSPAQRQLALILTAYDPEGNALGEHRLAAAADGHAWFDAAALGGKAAEPGHLELRYDDAARGPVDGWFHAIFRYRDRAGGHAAETSFGAHVFNSVVTYKGEPQSYAGPPPGLSTRLFLRLGSPARRTFCQLIYPASTRWHPRSQTRLILHGADGAPLAEKPLAIPVDGSRWLELDECFDPAELERAGAGGYVIVRDRTCRLFGYHGLRQGDCFSLDHMFGF